ncbi:hypothetical protein PR048_027436 [Dryococelus australis]|uniref:Uncharacterized protein n=1 Tax=Dryococelus australis TaxID=614101 RepID=A0ABQ9GFG6_9NEOP|nr:hypothetical protein PR048_027436 [Dryococelus australis]
MERISWVERVSNEEVLERVDERRKLLKVIREIGRRTGWDTQIWVSHNIEVLRSVEGCSEVSMKQRRNERAGETGDPREKPPTSGIVRHDSHVRKSGRDHAWNRTREHVPTAELKEEQRAGGEPTLTTTEALESRRKGSVKEAAWCLCDVIFLTAFAHNCFRAEPFRALQQTHTPPIPQYPASLRHLLKRYDGNTSRLARRSDEALGVRVSVARITPSLLDLGCGAVRCNKRLPDSTTRPRHVSAVLAGSRVTLRGHRIAMRGHRIAKLAEAESSRESTNRATDQNSATANLAALMAVTSPDTGNRCVPMTNNQDDSVTVYYYLLQHSSGPDYPSPSSNHLKNFKSWRAELNQENTIAEQKQYPFQSLALPVREWVRPYESYRQAISSLCTYLFRVSILTGPPTKPAVVNFKQGINHPQQHAAGDQTKPVTKVSCGKLVNRHARTKRTCYAISSPFTYLICDSGSRSCTALASKHVQSSQKGSGFTFMQQPIEEKRRWPERQDLKQDKWKVCNYVTEFLSSCKTFLEKQVVLSHRWAMTPVWRRLQLAHLILRRISRTSSAARASYSARRQYFQQGKTHVFARPPGRSRSSIPPPHPLLILNGVSGLLKKKERAEGWQEGRRYTVIGAGVDIARGYREIVRGAVDPPSPFPNGLVPADLTANYRPPMSLMTPSMKEVYPPIYSPAFSHHILFPTCPATYSDRFCKCSQFTRIQAGSSSMRRLVLIHPVIVTYRMFRNMWEVIGDAGPIVWPASSRISIHWSVICKDIFKAIVYATQILELSVLRQRMEQGRQQVLRFLEYLNVLNFTVLSLLEPVSYLHWLLHRCEATPSLTELHFRDNRSPLAEQRRAPRPTHNARTSGGYLVNQLAARRHGYRWLCTQHGALSAGEVDNMPTAADVIQG